MPRDNITILDLNILKMERDFNNQHGYMFRFLVYVSLITTFILISYLKPHRFYNKFMSNIFNFSFNLRGKNFNFYNLIEILTILFGLLFLCILF